MKSYQFTLLLLIVNVLLLSSSNTLVMPFLPLYLKNELNCPQSDLNLYITLCYSVSFLVSAIATPIWGHFADRCGKKVMLMRVSVLLALSYLFCYLSTTPFELLLSRAFQGLSSGMTPAILSIAAVSVPKEKTGISMGFIQSSNIFGTILGPIFGGLVAQRYGVEKCFLITLSIVSVVCLLNLLFIKDVKENNFDTKIINKQSNAINYKDLLKDPIMQSLFVCIFLNALIIMSLVPILTNYVINTFSSENAIALSGIIFGLSGLAGAIASPMWGHFGNQKGFLKVLFLSSVFAGIFYFTLTYIDSVIMFGIIWFCAGFCICAQSPASNSIISKHFDNSCSTRAYSIIYCGQQLGNLFGPIICGLTLIFLDTQYLFTLCGVILIIQSIYLLTILLIKRKSLN